MVDFWRDIRRSFGGVEEVVFLLVKGDGRGMGMAVGSKSRDIFEMTRMQMREGFERRVSAVLGVIYARQGAVMEQWIAPSWRVVEVEDGGTWIG